MTPLAKNILIALLITTIFLTFVLIIYAVFPSKPVSAPVPSAIVPISSSLVLPVSSTPTQTVALPAIPQSSSNPTSTLGTSLGSTLGSTSTTAAPVPTPAINTPDLCLKAGTNYLASIGKTPGRSMQMGSWSWVAPYCSVQSGGDYSIHWNPLATAADTLGKYTIVPDNALTMPTPAPSTATPTIAASQELPVGCTQCSTGYYLCPKGIISAPGNFYDKQAVLISSYRLPTYDPLNPPVSVGSGKYYFRKMGTTC